MSAGANWKVGEVLEDRYRIDRVFTGGGMGIVYQARHLAWEIDVAIKQPRPELLTSPEQRRAFEQECQTWGELGLHPYVATCFYTREIGSVPCVVAEFVEGGSLRDWIDARRLYTGEDAAIVARILQTAIATAWGLAQAHDAGLIHCDMKPGNVLMTADAMAKITDFGLAKASRRRSWHRRRGWIDRCICVSGTIAGRGHHSRCRRVELGGICNGDVHGWNPLAERSCCGGRVGGVW